MGIGKQAKILNAKQQTMVLSYLENTRYTLYKILYALDIDLLQLISEKAEAIVNTNENLINKISLLDESSQQDLLKFLDSFDLKKK